MSKHTHLVTRGTRARAERVAMAKRLYRKYKLTFAEIAERMGLSSCTVHDYITKGTGRPQAAIGWHGPLPELDDDDRPTLEDVMFSHSTLADCEQHADPPNSQATRSSKAFAEQLDRAMDRLGIPRNTAQQWAGGREL